jgi:hypothetical protein
MTIDQLAEKMKSDVRKAWAIRIGVNDEFLTQSEKSDLDRIISRTKILPLMMSVATLFHENRDAEAIAMIGAVNTLGVRVLGKDLVLRADSMLDKQISAAAADTPNLQRLFALSVHHPVETENVTEKASS